MLLGGASEANAIGEVGRASFSMSTIEPWHWAARGNFGSTPVVLCGCTKETNPW